MCDLRIQAGHDAIALCLFHSFSPTNINRKDPSVSHNTMVVVNRCSLS